MKRSLALFACVVLWSACVLSVAGWVRSRRACDHVTYQSLRPTDGGAVNERRVTFHSSNGGFRLEVLWGLHVDLGEPANSNSYGKPGFFRFATPPRGYPSPDQNQWGRQFAGFGIEQGEYPRGWPGPYRVRWYGLVLPYAFVAAVTGIVPLLWLRRERRQARASAAGRCTSCGYDLRGTPDGCPECGTATADMPPARPPRTSRALAVTMLALPLAAFPVLHRRDFFTRPPILPARAVTRTIPSPTVWAPRKLAPPANFGAYVETIAGSTVTFTMVPIPGGTFRMGSTIDETGHEDDEGPQVDVVVEPFYIGKYEVTQPEYTEFLGHYDIVARSGAARGAPLPQARWADAVTYPTPFYELEAGPILGRMGRGAGFPAVMMSHYAARQYTKWLSRKTGRFYRLATEAEWEYACRAGTTTAYHFGDDPTALGDYAWTFDNAKLPDGEPGYHPVGTKLPNAWGLHDMHGNVAEWVIDRYDPKHYETLAEQSPTGGEGVPIAAARAVLCPAKRYARSIRGGGYESEAVDCRSAARFGSNRVLNNKDPMLPPSGHWESNAVWVGFRVVCPVREPSEAEKSRYWDEEDPAALGPIIQSTDRQIRDLVPPYP